VATHKAQAEKDEPVLIEPMADDQCSCYSDNDDARYKIQIVFFSEKGDMDKTTSV
jgi:hypothetical protein